MDGRNEVRYPGKSEAESYLYLGPFGTLENGDMIPWYRIGLHPDLDSFDIVCESYTLEDLGRELDSAMLGYPGAEYLISDPIISRVGGVVVLDGSGTAVDYSPGEWRGMFIVVRRGSKFAKDTGLEK
jgi:hypothetical protein